MPFTLVLGGARSGKTNYALRMATAAGGPATPPVMIATAQAFDDEMRARIDRHRADRGDAWRTVEAPLGLAAALADLGADDVAVVDCLTLWLTNVILAEREVAEAQAELLATLAACPARLWLVSNEVGLGLVPEMPLGRRFRDASGELHQALAAEADEVVMIIAGLPLRLKSLAEAQP